MRMRRRPSAPSASSFGRVCQCEARCAIGFCWRRSSPHSGQSPTAIASSGDISFPLTRGMIVTSELLLEVAGLRIYPCVVRGLARTVGGAISARVGLIKSLHFRADGAHPLVCEREIRAGGSGAHAGGECGSADVGDLGLDLRRFGFGLAETAYEARGDGGILDCGLPAGNGRGGGIKDRTDFGVEVSRPQPGRGRGRSVGAVFGGCLLSGFHADLGLSFRGKVAYTYQTVDYIASVNTWVRSRITLKVRCSWSQSGSRHCRQSGKPKLT